MKEIGYALELEAPALLAGAPPASNLLETRLEIPGSSVRGLLARQALEAGWSPASDPFLSLFVAGGARFGTARLDGSLALPLSARSCKREDGFLAEGGHGVVDLLLGVGPTRCPRCDQALASFEGDWQPRGPARLEAATRLLTRTAIDPRLGTAARGRLYAQRVLAEGQRFEGCIGVEPAHAEHLAALLGEPFRGRLGRGSSRGQGWCRLTRHEAVALPWGNARERAARFAERAGRSVLAVTLLADAHFEDDFLRDAGFPQPDDLAALGLDPRDWEPEPAHAFLERRLLAGFDGEPVRLPRPERMGVAAGSCYLFDARCESPRLPAGDGLGWIGNGLRDGLGRAVLWHPFHLEPEEPLS